MDIMQEEPQTDKKKIKQDIFHTYAWRVINGEAGEYVYSLHEGYIYSYENGVWKKVFENEFLDRVERAIPDTTKYPIGQRKQIIENFKYKHYIRIEILNNYPLINFENCMFDPMGMNVLSHKKEYYSTIRIPYKYDELSKCELWIKTLNEIFEGNQEKIKLLQEFFGYCLDTSNEQKKGLLLLGDTDTGKSTILDILREILGDENISNVPLKHLSNPQYTPLLINKIVNLDPDVDKTATEYEREFKIITGGKNEKVSCNQKHIPTFEFVPKCKIILAANEFPRITDYSSAFYQRLILIPCERRFMENEKNRNLHTELKKELPGIFNWFLEGLHRLKTRGRFEQHDFMKDALEELQNDNNPTNSFFKEFITAQIGDDIYIEKGDLYEKYVAWCIKTNTFKLNMARFSSCVYKVYFKFTPKDTHHPATRKRIWRNLKYKTELIPNAGWQDSSS